MFKKIKNSIILALVAVFALSAPMLIAVHAYADSKTDICTGVGIASGGTDSTCGTPTGGDNLNTIIKNVVQILSIVVGIAAVIMIIIGGFRYVTSGGDSGNVNGAKNTILYALVGLVIAALAQVLVHYVLARVP